MKTKATLIGCLVISCLLLISGTSEAQKPLTDYVYQYIGTINPKTRGTTPVTKIPGGNITVFPTFNPNVTDMYFSDKIFGFPLGVANLMVSTGDVKVGSAENASRFDHDHETATPHYYQVLLEDPNIDAEFTVTKNTVLFRFTLPENEISNLLLSLTGNANAEIKNNKTIEGVSETRGRNRNATFKRYFYAELNKPVTTSGAWKDKVITKNAKSVSGSNTGLYVSYQTGGQTETIEIKVGLSSNSMEEARGFVSSEIGSMSFDQVKNKGRDLWNEELALIKVKGGTEKQRSLFYTTLHRSRALRMGNVWDTYRCAYPLQILIRPEETNEVIRGWLKTYDATGWLPSSGAMIGHHSTAVIVDAYFKGVATMI